jgi:hypothetical protein
MKPAAWVVGGFAVVGGIVYFARHRGPRVFISFQKEDAWARNLLAHQARDSNFAVRFVDKSLHEAFDEKWKTNCRKRIASTQGTIVLIGQDTYRAEAVSWEIGETLRQGHPCFGIQIHKDKSHRVPGSLQKTDVIRWTMSGIVNRMRAW